MDAGELDLEDLPPKALRKLIKSILAKRGKPNDDKQSEESDKEREELADLHAEHKMGDSKKDAKEKPDDTEEEDPFDLNGKASEDPEEASGDNSENDTEGVPATKKKPPQRSK